MGGRGFDRMERLKWRLISRRREATVYSYTVLKTFIKSSNVRTTPAVPARPEENQMNVARCSPVEKNALP
jgi:hypothetical protein